MIIMSVKKGDKIKIEYAGMFDDGTVFDESKKHGKPLEFEVGAGQVIKGLDEAIVGMNLNEEKKIRIEAASAYGPQRAEMVQKISRDQMPKGQEIKEGMVLAMTLQTGQQMPVRVVAVDEKEVTMDMNHPLAGKDLTFVVTIVGIN
jgi:peptidylprolyl isomerase